MNKPTKEEMLEMFGFMLEDYGELTADGEKIADGIRALISASPEADNKTLMRLAQDEGISFSVAKIIYDKAWREAEAFFKALAPSPAPLAPQPAEVEAAIAVEYLYRWKRLVTQMAHNGWKSDDEAAFAIIRAALTEARQPKRVSRERAATFRQRAENSRNPK